MTVTTWVPAESVEDSLLQQLVTDAGCRKHGCHVEVHRLQATFEDELVHRHPYGVDRYTVKGIYEEPARAYQRIARAMRKAHPTQLWVPHRVPEW